MKNLRKFIKNKKGVSQFVELIVIIGLTVGIGTIAISYVTKAIAEAKKRSDSEKLPDDLVEGNGGLGHGHGTDENAGGSEIPQA